MTTLSDLISHFSDRDIFPIHIHEIKDWIIKHTFVDEIGFWPCSYDPAVLKGSYAHYHRATGVYALPNDVVEITFYDSANDCQRRFICCKELMHVFDGKETFTSTPEQIEQLMFHLLTPQDQEAPQPDIIAENRAYYAALCVLAPLKIVNQLKALVSAGTITQDSVAEFLRIPKIYVGFLLSERYPVLYNRMLNLPATTRKAASK